MMRMSFNAVTPLAEDRGTGRASQRLFRVIIVHRMPSIIRTSESMALQHQHDSKTL